MPAIQLDRAALIGGALALGLGGLLGAHYRMGRPAPNEAQADAGALLQWAAPAADAAETVDAVSPPLYVQDEGEWVTPADRAQRLADAQAQADQADETAAQQASLAQAIAGAATASTEADPATPADPGPATQSPPAPSPAQAASPPIPPPIVIGVPKARWDWLESADR